MPKPEAYASEYTAQAVPVAVPVAQPAMTDPLIVHQQTTVVLAPGQFARAPPHCCCKLIFPVCSIYWSERASLAPLDAVARRTLALVCCS